MHKLIKILFGMVISAIGIHAAAQVGMRDITYKGLPITVVYPTETKSITQTRGAIQFDVAMNAVPKNSARHRLIVMSHGTGGSAYTDHQLAATLVRAGYVVAQPLHSGDNWSDSSRAGPESWKTRPAEMTATIDALVADPTFAPLFDASKIGIHGMSAGGISVIAQAGGQWSLLTMAKQCANHLDADFGFCMNGLVGKTYEQIKRRMSFYAANLAPENYLPTEVRQLHGAENIADPRMDKRIQAATLAVPLVAPFTSESLSRIHIPVGVISADSDQLLNPQFHSAYLLANCKSCTLLSELKNAGHFDLLSPWPESVAKQVGALQARGGYPNPKFNAADRAAAFDLIAQFFNQHL